MQTRGGRGNAEKRSRRERPRKLSFVQRTREEEIIVKQQGGERTGDQLLQGKSRKNKHRLT